MNENINIDRLFLSRDIQATIPSQMPTSGGGLIPIDVDAFKDNAVSICPLGFVVKFSSDDLSAGVNNPPSYLVGAKFRAFIVSPVFGGIWTAESNIYGYQLILPKDVGNREGIRATFPGFDASLLSIISQLNPGFNMGTVSILGSFINDAGQIRPMSVTYSTLLPIAYLSSEVSGSAYAIPLKAGVYYAVGPLEEWRFVFALQCAPLFIGDVPHPQFMNFHSATQDFMKKRHPLYNGYYPDIASMPEILKKQFPASWR